MTVYHLCQGCYWHSKVNQSIVVYWLPDAEIVLDYNLTKFLVEILSVYFGYSD